MRKLGVVFVLMFVATALWAGPAAAQEAIGQAAVVRGEVFVDGPGNMGKRPLKARDAVFQEQVIITGDRGKVQIIFNDDTIFTIGRNAEITLDQFVYDPATGNGHSDIKAKKGTFKFVTGKIAKQTPETVKVRTPFATIGVRGSGGIVEVMPNGATTVGLTQCCLDIYANGMPENAPPVPLDDVNTFTRVEDPAAPPTPPAPMPPEMLDSMSGALAENDTAPAPGEEGQPATGEQLANEDGTPLEPGEGEDGTAGEPVAGNDPNNPLAEGDQPVEKRLADRVPGEGDPNAPLNNEGDPNQPPLADNGPAPGVEGNQPPPEGDFVATGEFGGFPPPPGTGGDDFNDFTDGFSADEGFFFDDGTQPPLTEPIIDGTDTTSQTSQDNTYQETSGTSGDSSTAPDTHAGVARTRKPGDSYTLDHLDTITGRRLSGGDFLAHITGSDGHVFDAVLPMPHTGLFSVPTISVDGQPVFGWGYLSSHGTFATYGLTDVNTGEAHAAMVGTLMDAASIPVGGRSFYNFLRDPLLSAANPGFFDYHTLNGGIHYSPTGMVVDWDASGFLGGGLMIEDAGNAGAGDARFTLKVSFGDIDNANTALSGKTYSFESSISAGTTLHGGTFGVGGVEADDFYGNSTTGVDGFALETTHTEGNGFTAASGAEAFSYNAAVVTAADTRTSKLLGVGRTATVFDGFSAGHMYLEGRGFVKFESGLAANMITKSTNALSASFGLTSTSSDSLNVAFGSTASAESAYLSDQAYAMEMGVFQLGEGTAAANANQFEGVMVSEIVNPGPTCETCQFVHWGVWAAKVEEGSLGGQTYGELDQVHLIPYVAGVATTSTEAAARVGQSINFNGTMFGSQVMNNSDISHHYGNFNLNGTFGTGMNFTGGWAGYTLTASGITGANTFSNGISVTGNGMSGTGGIDGSFFGAAASEVGGQFGFTATDGTNNVSAGGIFIGKE